MRKLYLILIITILPLYIYPQVWASLSAGINNSYVKFDDSNFNDYFKHYLVPFIGLQYGANMDIYFSEALSLNLKTAYSQKGFRYNQTYIYGWKRFNYLQTTFAGKIDFNPYEKNVFAISIAPYLAYWLSGKKLEAYRKTQTILSDKIPLNADTTFSYNRLDAGITFALHLFHYINKKTRLEIAAGTDFGMVSNAKENVAGTKNRNYFITAGIEWRIKKH